MKGRVRERWKIIRDLGERQALITFYCKAPKIRYIEKKSIRLIEWESSQRNCAEFRRNISTNNRWFTKETESLPSWFGFSTEPTARSPFAPTLYWSHELLCYCAPFPEVNISETSEMLCRSKHEHTRRSNQMWLAHTDRVGIDVTVVVLMLRWTSCAENIASSKRKNINNSFFSPLLLAGDGLGEG